MTNLQNSKYPVFYSLGCYSGNIHTTTTGGQSEEFILNDGYMIAYVGTSGTGFVNALSALGKIIYNNTGNTMYGQSLGKILHKSIETNDISDSDSYVTLNQQFTFHSDPAIKLYTFDGPDYLIDYETVKVDPSVINSNSENFTFSFDVVNIGSVVADSLSMMILRTLPSGKIDTTYQTIASPKARSTVNIDLETYGDKGIGENCLGVILNYNNKISEVPTPDALDNNKLQDQNGENKFCFYIINNGVRILFPNEFSIVNKSDVELQAATYDYFLDDEKYIIQIDTTELFNSPQLKQTVLTTKGGLIKWKPEMEFTHNSVYYWRITPDSINEQVTYNWSSSSFVFLENSSEGWNQSHYYQWLKDDFDDMEFNGRRLDYSEFLRSFDFNIRKYDPQNPTMVTRDGEQIGAFKISNLAPAIVIGAYGPRTKFFPNVSMQDYGSVPFLGVTFVFKTNTLEGRKGIKDLLEAIPDSATVMIISYANGETQSLYPEEWAADSIQLGYNIFSVLESYGANYIRLMETRGTVPYLFIFKKGSNSVIFEDIGKTANSTIETSILVPERYYDGSSYSTIIGPAKNWNKVLWKEQNKLEGQESFVKITKLNSDLTQQIIVDSLENNYEYDITSIDADQYPYLKLDLNMSDLETRRTTPDFDFWRVLYEGYPDAVLIHDDNAYFYNDTLDLGDNFKFKTTVYNSSQIDMDSLLVKYKIKKEDNEEIVVLKRYKPLLAGSSYEISFEYPTDEIAGENEFSVEINANKEQEEMYYFNNYGIKRFYVRSDDTNPIMDVTFDGVHIMDGDIINPKPLIKVTIVDDNQYQLLNDISIIKKLSLVYPSGQTSSIDLTNTDQIEFIPAESLDDNKATLNFYPDLYEEGEYKLLVQTTDISGNLSGANDYKISFKVIFKEQISEVYNYPNPFSTKTRFVFTLTGKELPKDVVIKIMTLSGKIVRELNSFDLGGFKYGINITENYWDGTDEYGRLLANGIYLYEVTAVNVDGKAYEKIKSNENTDKFFKEGIGKLVILR
ncbi:MAG: C25 family cysteine peptidase [Saprospiraceae bacterium]